MSEPALRQQIVRLDDALNVTSVDAHGNAHEHLLRTLANLAVDLEKVRTLESLESEKLRNKKTTQRVKLGSLISPRLNNEFTL